MGLNQPLVRPKIRLLFLPPQTPQFELKYKPYKL
jgi:hypothetical protein